MGVARVSLPFDMAGAQSRALSSPGPSSPSPAPTPDPSCSPGQLAELPILGPLLEPLLRGLLAPGCGPLLDTSTPRRHAQARLIGMPSIGVLDAGCTVGYLAVAVFLGGLLFITMLWPAGAEDRRTRRILGGACLLGGTSAVVGVVVRGAYAGAASLTDVLSPQMISAVLDTPLTVASSRLRRCSGCSPRSCSARCSSGARLRPPRRAGGCRRSPSGSVYCAPAG